MNKKYYRILYMTTVEAYDDKEAIEQFWLEAETAHKDEAVIEWESDKKECEIMSYETSK